MKKTGVFFVLILLFASYCSYSQTLLRGNLTAGYNLPFGEFADQYKGGVSVEAGIFYVIPVSGINLTITSGYNSLKFKNEYFTDLVKTKLNYGVSGFNVSWTATDIPIMVGARYKFPVGNIKPYVTGEVGLHFVSFTDRFSGSKITGNASDPTTFNLNGATESGSEVGIGTSIGAGIEIPVAPKISLDLNAKYNYAGVKYSKAYNVFINNSTQFTTIEMKNMSDLTIRGGIVIDF
jgi:opacity protein-like surface antigen